MKLIISLALLLGSFNGMTQNGIIRGLTVEGATKDRIPFAKVTLHLGDAPAFNYAQADFEGVFQFSDLTSGTYTIKFNSIEYEEVVIEGVIVLDNRLTLITGEFKRKIKN